MDFDSFTRSSYASVVRTVALALGDVSVAEDATQDAYAKAALLWDRVAAMERPEGWVCVVAINAGRRALRRKRPPAKVTAPDSPDPANGVVGHMMAQQLLMGLPAQQRAALVLRFLGDLSVADTARALRVSQGTVKAATHVALAKLRITLEGADDASR